MAKILIGSSLSNALDSINNYMRNGVFSDELTYYIYQEPYTMKVGGQAPSFVEDTDEGYSSEIAVIVFSDFPAKRLGDELGETIISELRKSDASSSYDYTISPIEDGNKLLKVDYNDSTLWIIQWESYGLVTVRNVTPVSFDSNQLDLTDADNLEESKTSLIRVMDIISNYLTSTDTEK